MAVHGRLCEKLGEPEFRYLKNGDYIGDLCPACSSEMFIEKRGPQGQFVRCHCGYGEKSKEYVRCMREKVMRWSSGRRDSPFWPTSNNFFQASEDDGSFSLISNDFFQTKESDEENEQEE